jgi:hypothetical protein
MTQKILVIIFTFFLVKCTSFDEVGKTLRNEKRDSTDEFLIKKNDPLSIPPKMDELPTPKSKSTIKNKTTDISELLGKTNTPQKKDTSEIEKLILEEIRKR